ncbi:MAG: translation initiation factor IF-3 [Candidatus Eisenbacteria bacterium]
MKTIRINDRIRVPQIRLIDEEGNMLGVTETREALQMAQERGFDLVEVSPGAVPPVCRIMDYGKYKYEQSKKAKKAKKKQHVMHVKEIKMRPKIETHDYGFKMNHARRFLEENNKVKFSLIFRGREVTHPDIGLRILKRVAEELAEIATVEAGPKREGMTMMMVICPKPSAIKEPDKKERVTEERDATYENSGEIEETTQEST